MLDRGPLGPVYVCVLVVVWGGRGHEGMCMCGGGEGGHWGLKGPGG